MPLKNYTTEIPAMKSIGQIQGNLVTHGAKAIMINYGEDREPESLAFIIKTAQGEVPFQLPANRIAVERILLKSYDPNYRSYDKQYQEQKKAKVHEQSSRVAWRILTPAR